MPYHNNNGSGKGGSALNTILLFIVLGVLGWIGRVSWTNSMDLAKLTGAQMTREQIEKKISDEDAKIIAQDAKINALTERLGKDEGGVGVLNETVQRHERILNTIKR